MSERRLPPFANDLQPLAHEAAWFVDPLYKEDLNRDIQHTIYRVGTHNPLFPEFTLSIKDQAEMFIKIYNDLLIKTTGYTISKVVGFMIQNNHPYLAGWEEGQKRNFLDAALGDEILRLQTGIARSERDNAYFRTKQKSGSRLHREEQDMAIEKYRTLQSKLRQRASPSSHGQRK